MLSFACLCVKSRYEGAGKITAGSVALGVNLLGEKELLGISGSMKPKGRSFSLCLSQIPTTGCSRLLCRLCGLVDEPAEEAFATVFPHTQVYVCLVHKVWQSLRCVVWQERRPFARD
ncbi:transposase [Nitrospira sp. M1]